MTNMTNESLPLAKKNNVVLQNVDSELLIYDLENQKAFCLNETSAFVWQNADGKKSISDITKLAQIQLNPDSSEELIWLALDQLKNDNLLENGEVVSDSFSSLNRRALIKKIGLTSMVALPVITSIVAPMAANAQSGCAAIQTITRSGATCASAPNCLADCQFFYGNDATAISCADNTPAPNTRTCTCCDVV